MQTWRPAVAVFLLMTLPTLSVGLQCLQCAAVDGRTCPNDAKMVDSATHDACITWRLGNGTVILQNVVLFENECTAPKIEFWTNFIDLYYQTSGGEVRCCDEDGCNSGGPAAAAAGASVASLPSDSFFVRSPASGSASASSQGLLSEAGAGNGALASELPGAPLIFGAVSSAPPLTSSQVRTQPKMHLN